MGKKQLVGCGSVFRSGTYVSPSHWMERLPNFPIADMVMEGLDVVR